MELWPKLELTWLNGWLLHVAYLIIFGGTVLSFPKDVIAKLYDRSNWTRTQRTLTLIGKFISAILLILLVWTPLKIGEPVFWIGLTLFVLGMVGVMIALFNFKAMTEGEPATRGLYKVSRNPQWLALLIAFLGSCLATGSGVALLLFLVAATCYHFRILGEERACLEQYGDAYRNYMKQVPRYLLIF